MKFLVEWYVAWVRALAFPLVYWLERTPAYITYEELLAGRRTGASAEAGETPAPAGTHTAGGINDRETDES